MSEVETVSPPQIDASVSKAWLRALELTASIPRNRDRILSSVIEVLGARLGEAPALLSDRESFTYRSLVDRSNQYARWALEQGLAKGEVVGLLMPNRPEYFAVWLGITSMGGVVALFNTNLVGASLTHCIKTVEPRQLIVDCEYADQLTTSLQGIEGHPTVWIHGADHDRFSRIDRNVDQQSRDKLSENERPELTIEDRALYIFTSGTTGLPKAANVTHARILQWSYWFSGIMGVKSDDRIYNCLPMYHSIGGVLVPGAFLIGGGSVVIREKFSASNFWNDIVRWDCTAFQYIGEFCRYLLHANVNSAPQNHRIRLACGNGLAPDVWDKFKERFHIPHVLEFYAATEGNISLFNVEEKRGAIGRIPPYLAHRFSPLLIRFDVEKGSPVRDNRGFCVRCASNETGEAIGRILDNPSSVGNRFDGYTDKQASDAKILRNVFEPDDAWVRTGDLMRKDEAGFFYFVDRVGDTFRWKGENVSTSEVSEAICEFSGIEHAIVYGVAVPNNEGRVGMATLVAEQELDLVDLRRHLMSRLPAYARPAFLRLRNEVDVTGTFKYSKTDLVRQGFGTSATADAIYFDDPESQSFTRLDQELSKRIESGQIRL